MMGVIARKELVQALLTYRFAVGLILCTVAVAAGMLAALEDYGSRQQAYHQELQTYQAEVLNARGPLARLVWDLKAFRAPPRLAVFSSGSERWQGHQVTVTHHHVPRQSRWLGLANPYMALFPLIEVSLLVQVVVGLLALLFAHDAVSGEREEGTLHLMLANPVARDQVLAGKALGHLGALGLILAVAFGVAVLFVQSSPLLRPEAEELGRVGALFVVSFLYGIAMYSAGLLLSTWTRRSATSLVLAVFGWLLAVAVYPNAVGFVAVATSPLAARVKAAQELENQLHAAFGDWLKAYSKEAVGAAWGPPLIDQASVAWSSPRGYYVGGFRTQEYVERIRRWLAEKGLPPWPQEADSEEEIQRRAAELRRYFSAVEQQRMRYAEQVWRQAWEPVEEEMKAVAAAAAAWSLLSPAAAYRQASAVLAGTDRGGYGRFLAQARHYRRQLIAHYQEEGWFARRAWFDPDQPAGLETLPRFTERREGLGARVGRAAAPLVVLAGYSAVFFAGACLRFRRGDL